MGPPHWGKADDLHSEAHTGVDRRIRDRGGARRFVLDAYRHGKSIGALGTGLEVLKKLLPDGLRVASGNGDPATDQGVVSGSASGDAFIEAATAATAAHRHPHRPQPRI
ncbi:hypothetical protein [Streptomyces sp. NPDC101150]|uniref:hypothetical protein n=1 Tax=Streptomyces sp. NPDC101150 TaxID=3366114 RepID=UPI0037F616C6